MNFESRWSSLFDGVRRENKISFFKRERRSNILSIKKELSVEDFSVNFIVKYH